MVMCFILKSKTSTKTIDITKKKKTQNNDDDNNNNNSNTTTQNCTMR